MTLSQPDELEDWYEAVDVSFPRNLSGYTHCTKQVAVLGCLLLQFLSHWR